MNRICSALLCLVGLSACDSDSGSVDQGSVDFRVAHQESSLAQRGHEIWLFVGDDANTQAAAALRERVAAALRLPDGGPYDGSCWLCPGDGFDPSHEDPIDIRVVVALREQEQLRLLDESRPLFVRVFASSTRDDESPALASNYDIGSMYHMNADDSYFFEVRTLFSPAAEQYLDFWKVRTQSMAAPRFVALLRPLEQEFILESANSPDNFFHSTALQSKTVQRCFNAPPKRHPDGSIP